MDSFELLKNGAPNERIAAAHTLKYAISEYPLHPVLDIWYAAKDLIEPTKPPAARIAGWELLTECVKHGSSTDLERKEYFQTLAAPASSEDFHLQLAALVDLTQSGRVLDGFDYDLLPLLTRWLSEAYEAVRNARRDASSTARGSRSSTRNRTAVLGEEKNFAQLFAFIMDVIKFSFKNADDVSLARMIDGLLDICMSTSVEDDLRMCISVLDAIVTFGSIPNDKLKGCVQVLSSIYCLVPALQKDAWRTLSNFFKSHNGQATVRILLDVLRGLTPESSKDRDMTREIRGALAVLRNLLSKSSEEGYPAVPYALLADGLSAAVEATNSSKVYLALLQVVNSLFEDVAGGLHHLVVDEDWSSVLAVATQCAQKTNVGPEKTRSRSYLAADLSEDPVMLELVQLVTRLEEVITQKTKDYLPRQTIIRFFVSVHSLLPDSTACAVLDYFQEFRCCSPADLEWEDNLDLVLVAFFGNRERSSETRLKALRTIMDAYEILDLIAEDAERDSVPKLAKSVLKEVTEESDVLVLEAVISLMVSIVSSCEEDLFDHVLGALRGVVDNDRLQSPISPPVMGGVAFGERDKSHPLPGQSPSNVVTKGYVQMFVAVMNSDGVKSQKLYNALLQIARSPQSEQDARLTAMKLLFRIRADWANKIYLTKELETNFLAPTLCRTEASLAKKQAIEAAGTLRTSRSDHGGLTRSSRGISFSQGQVSDKTKHGSNLKSTASSYRQLWALPDPDAIPGDIPKLISQFLVSHKAGGEGEDESDDDQNTSTYVLDMPAWLECVLAMLRGSDWEIYSFVLVHLPSQLSNHAVFKDALRQMQDLRKHICEQVRSNSFNEPPNTSGLRRADVAICLFHSLTMILSYHDNFKKSEEDDIVKTFVHGISAWERTAPCCIHGLTICCHELPLSVSKSLGQMLNQMAAIITQPHVSIHILEFLACLSKLHDVYVNFREDEYRTVFGICFRYLESARDKRRATKAPASSEPTTPAGGSGPSVDLGHPNAADDLPQYVYALGYHVILFWFLALKLPDRATHVGAIARKLFNDVDGSGTMSEEQALIAIDFMQRVTYADINESGEDHKFTSQRMGELVTKRWLVGNSIVAIKQSTRTGWAEVTKRQPSGTSTYMVREALRPAPLHQTGNQPEFGRDGQVPTNVVLPSHLMIQLMSSIPQSCDVARPIILPDDEATDRMLRVMDRNPTVDGHKIGVIYIGEGQTDEVEILSNVSGSSDYHEFLNQLGTLVKLKGAKFNTQGLDREMDMDGEYAYAWRDRLTEIVFHVTTQMPTNLQNDPQLSMKKRHIGNDFVNIIYNDSGLPFKFDTFPSQFNYVNIVITPASRASFIAAREARRAERKEQPFYRVQVMSKPGFPEISPASEVKMVSLKALPDFIRLVALNASVFSLIWQARGGEHVSSWRARLREIKRLRERYAPKAAIHSHSAHHLSPSPPPNASGGGSGAAQQYPQLQAQQIADSSRPSSSVRDSFTSLRRTSVATFFTNTSEQTSHRSSMLSGSATTADTEMGNSPSGAAQQLSGSDLNADAVDFSKWT
ncbi:Tuberous sclerosis 2 protein-like protein [Emericellopsis cladophorae]|uniref:Tuberous sclerosis 2 protein-like protein n=1 Tax=Emericellopsis cladophorae TaxID=2686198 RepID=A0A9Q0BEZ0_9HYPO|nr:Tuberous sclerosis 2 protein-like protein [Emericellopsis cladophorae]KAI6782947.1 Tuberous sclerosis 2 protein-like protein [Emericellopsis cladophorae]